MNNSGRIFIVLLDCGKEDVLKVEDRVREIIKSYASYRKLMGKIEFSFRHVTYPDEAGTVEAVINKAEVIE
jgi:hypothetical protein